MPRARRMSNAARCWVSLALIGTVAVASPVLAQEREQDDHPLIRNVEFTGVSALDEAELRQSIVTRETRCLSVLLQPVCWVTDWSAFFDEHYLDREELPRDELRLRILYFRRGYREAQVSSEVRRHGDEVDVVFHIQEGPPTLIQELVIRQEPQVLSERQIRRAGLPAQGDPLDLMRLDSAVAYLQTTLEDAGYLDAAVRDSVVVFPLQRSARVEVAIWPGPISTLAGFSVSGNREISDEVVEAATLLKPGDVLRKGEVLAARRSLYESNLFYEATVTVPPGQGPAKVVRVEVREAPPRVPAIGAGVNTVEFVQLDTRFTNYNFMGVAGRLDLRATVGNLLAPQLSGRWFFYDVGVAGPPFDNPNAFVEPTWQFSVELQQPSFRGAGNRLGVAAFTHRRIVPRVAVDRGFGANMSWTWRVAGGAPLSVGYIFEAVNIQAGDVYFCVSYGLCDLATIEALRTNHRMSPLSLSYLREETDNPVSPSSGHRMRIDLEHASAATASQFQYNRASGEAAIYWPVNALARQPNRVWAGRVRAGWAEPLGGTVLSLWPEPDTVLQPVLHPRKRFFSGGSRSVRGYAENQLGPRVLTVPPSVLLDPARPDRCTVEEIVAATCNPNIAPADAFLARPLGGAALLEANLEYRFPLLRRLGGAVFVDAGYVAPGAAAVNSPGMAAVTPGFGVRYPTPFGLVRVDVGIRPSVDEQLPVFTEVIDDEGARRLIQLDTPYNWRPLDGVGGLRQILGRLQLHLAIGQAF